MKQSLVSIIIPTYNRLDYLKESVCSALNQTYNNFEIIVSDNHSVDGTQNWMEGISNNAKVKYFRNRRNLGMTTNWNLGIKRSSGKYFVLLNDDDLWEPNFLSNTVKILDEKQNIGLVQTHTSIIQIISKNQSRPIIKGDIFRFYKSSRELHGIDYISDYLNNVWNATMPSAVLVRRECIDRLGFFDSEGKDLEMWLRLCSQYDYYYLNKTLVHWRYHDQVYSVTSTPLDYFKEKFYILDKLNSYQFKSDQVKRLYPLKLKAMRGLRQNLIAELIRGYQKKEPNLNIFKFYQKQVTCSEMFLDIITYIFNLIFPYLISGFKYIKSKKNWLNIS